MKPVKRNGMTMVPLTRRAGGVQAHKLILPGGWQAPSAPENTHEGYEWMFVLSGHLRLLLGDQDIVLKPGEAAEFDCRVPHAFGSADQHPLEVLALFGKQGERAHLRARAGS